MYPLVILLSEKSSIIFGRALFLKKSGFIQEDRLVFPKKSFLLLDVK